MEANCLGGGCGLQATHKPEPSQELASYSLEHAEGIRRVSGRHPVGIRRVSSGFPLCPSGKIGSTRVAGPSLQLVVAALKRRLSERDRLSLKFLNWRGPVEVAERGEEFVRLLQGVDKEPVALAAICVCLGIEALACGDYPADATS